MLKTILSAPVRLLELRKTRRIIKQQTDVGRSVITGLRDGIMDTSMKSILRKLHEIGGCDASDAWSQGWDAAIDEAIKIVEDESGIKITDVLD